MEMNPENVVRDFCAAWSRRNIEELLGFFTEEAVYHNMPMTPVQGHEGIRQVFQFFVPPAQEIEFEVRHITSKGPIVFTDRIDRFLIAGKKVELPVAGVFEVGDGKITAWRDYFDMQTWTAQTA